MTAKEKAKQLIERFGKWSFSPKECAIDCVGEIIDAIDNATETQNFFWADVREELEKTIIQTNT